MRFWLDKGVAGFRCDVINIIFKENTPKENDICSVFIQK
jgi:glycosidase